MDITRRAVAYAAVGVAIAIGGGVGAVAELGGNGAQRSPVQVVQNDANDTSATAEPEATIVPTVDPSASEAPPAVVDQAATPAAGDAVPAGAANPTPAAADTPASASHPAPATTAAPPPPPPPPATVEPTPTQTGGSLPTHSPQP